MFFTYKTEETFLAKNNIINYKCKQCKKINTTSVTIYAKYIIIYWVIPFMTLGRMAKSNCLQCNLEIDEKQFNEELKFAYQNFKINIKFPYWHNSGITLLAFLIWIIFK